MMYVRECLRKAFLSLLVIRLEVEEGFLISACYSFGSPVPSLHDKYMGKQWEQWLTLFFWAPKSLQRVIAAMKLKDPYSLEGKV